MNKYEIIPTIFALDNNVFKKKFEALEFSKKIHLDFMDGEFTKDKTIPLFEMALTLINPETNYELHMMAKDPIKYLRQILWLEIKTVLIHYEVFNSESELKETIEQFKKHELEVYVVLNPNTNPKVIENFKDDIVGVMVMGVIPGKEGQDFIEETYKTVEYIKENFSSLKIQVDGGISKDNIKKLKKSGVDYFSIGSSISSSENPRDAYDNLSSLI